MKKFLTDYGYFSEDGSEYIITTPRTPKPWINVISNGNYGLTISQCGGGFSWNEHSEFNRITRWHQDLIQDNWGKFFYFRDNGTGEIWSPTWNPVKTELDKFQCIHGIGYTRFISRYNNVRVEISIFVPFDDSLEIWDFAIHNEGEEEIDISVINYFEWVLGSSNDYHREFHKQFLETSFNNELNAITANKRLWDIPLGDRGHWNIDYPYTAFFACNREISSYVCDKESFIGKYGSLEKPQAVVKGSLNGKCGKFYDSIASLKIDLKISPNRRENITYYLGIKEDDSEIKSTLQKYWSRSDVDNALEALKQNWSEILSTQHIETPDEGMNFMVNKWARYQAISGRLWGRTAYYQQSGAFGFRDQLQDSLVFLPIDAEQTVKQIRIHARHQFRDGTVLHWWHPISETGLVTKMTDDLLWLPFVVSEYIQETANYDLLDEREYFYDDKEVTATIFEHCMLAVDRVLIRISKRGLPLIGAGDWNDGMSAVGLEMKGESIWLTEFLYYILNRFIKIAEYKGQKDLALKLTKDADNLQHAFDKYAWDDDWFIRATKDSGDKIGSKECDEGKIYLNPQTWAVISDITDDERKSKAMDSVKKYLLKKNGTLLLQPAYTNPDKYIGYLSRYAAGRRENGGVYTHAATWSIWAFSILNDKETAFDIFKRLCPIYAGLNPEEYVAEPYVLPGNIDGPDSPNYGMAGWTWYTGSASWFQKVVVDWILGIRASEKGLIIDPKFPKEWNKCVVKRKFRETNYIITILNDESFEIGIHIELDGVVQSSNIIIPNGKTESNVTVRLNISTP